MTTTPENADSQKDRVYVKYSDGRILVEHFYSPGLAFRYYQLSDLPSVYRVAGDLTPVGDLEFV